MKIQLNKLDIKSIEIIFPSFSVFLNKKENDFKIEGDRIILNFDNMYNLEKDLPEKYRGFSTFDILLCKIKTKLYILKTTGYIDTFDFNLFDSLNKEKSVSNNDWVNYKTAEILREDYLLPAIKHTSKQTGLSYDFLAKIPLTKMRFIKTHHYVPLNIFVLKITPDTFIENNFFVSGNKDYIRFILKKIPIEMLYIQLED